MKTSLLELCRSYLTVQSLSTAVTDTPKIAVTISREAGAGAVQIASLVAEELTRREIGRPIPWAVFDRNLVEEVLEGHGLPKEIGQYLREDRVVPIIDAIEEMLGVHPDSWTLLHHTVDTMLRLAVAGNVVLVGRGGNVITSRLKHVVHVRIVAPLAKRVREIEKTRQLSCEAAIAFAQTTDRARKRYVQQNFRRSVSDPLGYHLILNTGRMTHRQAAAVICDAVERCEVLHSA